jgi:hypothetical protein
MCFRPHHYTCRVGKAGVCVKLRNTVIKLLLLFPGKLILLLVGTGQMRHQSNFTDTAVSPERLVYIAYLVHPDAQPVHSGIKLDPDIKWSSTILSHPRHMGITVDYRIQAMTLEVIELALLPKLGQNYHRFVFLDAAALYTLGYCRNRKTINQRIDGTGNSFKAMAVCIGLNHCQQL